MSKRWWHSTMDNDRRAAWLPSAVAALIFLLAMPPAGAQTYTVQSPMTAPDFGIVAAATTGTTTFENDGSVDVISGDGDYVSGTVTRGQVTIRCVDGAGLPRRCNNANNKARVTVTTSGSPTGRGQDLSSFTAVAGTGVTLTGTTSGASLDFVMSGWTLNNQDRSFFLNVSLPILGDNASTATSATAGFGVKVALNPTIPTIGDTQNAAATVRRSTTVSKVSDIAFGTIIAPPKINDITQSGTVTIGMTVNAPNEGTSSRMAGGSSPPGIVAATPFSGGLFTLNAQAGTTFSLTAPTGMTMTGPGGNIPVTLTPSLSSGSHTMVPGGIGLGYGATITIDSETASGEYSGSFQVSIAYN